MHYAAVSICEFSSFYGQRGQLLVCLPKSSSALSLANWYGVEVQRNVTLLHRSKTTIRWLQGFAPLTPRGPLIWVHVTMLQVTSYVHHFKRVLDSGEGQAQIY